MKERWNGWMGPLLAPWRVDMKAIIVSPTEQVFDIFTKLPVMLQEF